MNQKVEKTRDARLSFYEKIDPEDREYVRERADLIRRATFERMIEIGDRLAEVQSRLAKYGDGNFQKWLTLEFPMSVRTAYNFIAVANAYHSDPQFARLTEDGELKSTALILLASSEKPALSAAVDALERGERLDLKTVRGIIDAHKTPATETEADLATSSPPPGAVATAPEIKVEIRHLRADFETLNGLFEVIRPLFVESPTPDLIDGVTGDPQMMALIEAIAANCQAFVDWYVGIQNRER